MQSGKFFCRIYSERTTVAFGLYGEFATVVSFREDIKDTIAEDECTLYLHGEVLYQISRLIIRCRYKGYEGPPTANTNMRDFLPL
jgi:hypothetical protein